MKSKQAVLILDFGGPVDQQAVKPFLIELFSDKNIIPLPVGRRWVARLITVLRLKKVMGQYAEIGGGSPLIEQSSRLVEKLKSSFEKSGLFFPVYLAMRYTPPFIQDVVWQMVREDIREVVVIPMFPQFSFVTTGSVFEEFHKAMQRLAPTMQVTYVRQWWEEEEYLFAWSKVIFSALEKFSKEEQKNVHLLFSAHSLPISLIKKKNDPYPAEIRKCAEKIIEKSGLKNPWHLSFQSKIGPVEWLGPSTDEKVRELGKEGVQNLVFIPISFLTDHLETLYEIDQLYIPIALKSGVQKGVRTEALVHGEPLLHALEKIALTRLLPLPISR